MRVFMQLVRVKVSYTNSLSRNSKFFLIYLLSAHLLSTQKILYHEDFKIFGNFWHDESTQVVTFEYPIFSKYYFEEGSRKPNSQSPFGSNGFKVRFFLPKRKDKFEFI